MHGVVVSYLEARADSAGFHLVTQNRDTTDTAGHYWILLYFEIHGALGFEKPGYRRVVYSISESSMRLSPDDDHELRFDVDLYPDSSAVDGTQANAE
jgi:hypothetical protein